MTKKRKRYPDLNQKLERPWCFYCERDFDDLKILISHQKAKHFKCERCGRRLNTAGGLAVHMNQVHKDVLEHVENAIAGRQGLDVEIFGMEGVPEEYLDSHNHEVTQKHFAEEAERQRLTGNPTRGTFAGGDGLDKKRARVHESLEDIDRRAEQYRQDRINGVLPTPAPDVVEEAKQAPAAQPFVPTIAPPFAPAPGFPPFPPAYADSIPGGAQLPQRPASGAAPPDALPAATEAVAEPAAEKKGKKEKNIKMVFFDEKVSPEEKMAKLPRYAEFMQT